MYLSIKIFSENFEQTRGWVFSNQRIMNSCLPTRPEYQQMNKSEPILKGEEKRVLGAGFRNLFWRVGIL
jgi:hypothetical protein